MKTAEVRAKPERKITIYKVTRPRNSGRTFAFGFPFPEPGSCLWVDNRGAALAFQAVGLNFKQVRITRQLAPKSLIHAEDHKYLKKFCNPDFWKHGDNSLDLLEKTLESKLIERLDCQLEIALEDVVKPNEIKICDSRFRRRPVKPKKRPWWEFWK